MTSIRFRNLQRAGFSLLELLVVIGLIALLSGGIGLALQRDDSHGVALQAAQTEVAMLLGAARSQAILRQTNVRLLIAARHTLTGDASGYLRGLQLVVENPTASGQWSASGDPVYLPRGIFIVPPKVSQNLLLPGLSWPGGASAPVSTISGPMDLTNRSDDFGDAYYVEYLADGRTSPGSGCIALGTARSSVDSGPFFDHPESVRGVRLRPGGGAGMIAGADEF